MKCKIFLGTLKAKGKAVNFEYVGARPARGAMKTKRIKVWCEFEGELSLQTRKKRVKIIEYNPETKRKIIHYEDRVIPPNDKYVRCPSCGRRLVPKHIVADRKLYLFSTIAKHKKWIKKSHESNA